MPSIHETCFKTSAKTNVSSSFPKIARSLCHALRSGSQKRGEQAGVEKVEFRRLDQTFQRIAEPRLQAAHKKQLLQNGDIFSGRLVVKSDLAAHLREIG